MSAGVSDQRMKGQGNQVNNGPKEQLSEGVAAGNVSEDFESWRSQQQAQQQQGGGAAHTSYATSVPISSATDPYNMSTAAAYYGSGGTFPYQAFGVGDGTWSNGTDPMTFLGGYTHDSYSMDGMFGPSTFSTTAFGQPSTFNYFPGNGDYSTWGTQLNQRKPQYDDYYRTDTQNMYPNPQSMQDTNITLKSVEQNMQNLNIDMNATSNLHMNTQLSHNLGPQLAKGDGKDMKGVSDGLKDGSMGLQPKKMTWASIASQPAKPQITLQSSGLKKKGPGMPPGPIVPGKHNMDIGTWDTNKSTPPQIPVVNTAPPPPPSKIAVNVRPAWTVPVRAQPGVQQPQQQPMQNRPPQPQQQQQQQQHMAQIQQQQQPPQPAPIQQQPPPQVAPVQQHYMQAPPHQVPTHLPPPPGPVPTQMAPPPPQQQQQQQQQQMMMPPPVPAAAVTNHPVLEELRVKNNYNPPDFDLNAPGARFFVIKSYSEDDIHRSIKYEIWCSTEHGNKRLDQAFREREKEPNGCVYLFFSVNGSGHFCGMAQMMSSVDYQSNSSVWSQDKWRGQFRVRWIYVKDVPNVQLRYIKLENNENKPVTNSRDTQEVPHARGLQVLRILHTYKHSTSIFDDFIHYEKRQEEEDSRKVPEPQPMPPQQQQQQQQQQQPQQHMNNQHRENHHHGGGGGNRENHHSGNRENHHSGAGHREGPRDNMNREHHGREGNHLRDRGDHRDQGGRDHRDRRNHDRDQMHDGGNHRSGNQRNHDGPHHKERGDNNSRNNRGRSSRNIN